LRRRISPAGTCKSRWRSAPNMGGHGIRATRSIIRLWDATTSGNLMPQSLSEGVGALVWSPLGWGRLTGKIRRGQPLPEGSRLHKTAEQGPQVPEEYLYQVVDALEALSRETGRSVPQLALNWVLRKPTVSSVIIGARNEQQLRDNLAAASFVLTAEQVAGLDKASEVPVAYPYWHQRQFQSRNPLPGGYRG